MYQVIGRKRWRFWERKWCCCPNSREVRECKRGCRDTEAGWPPSAWWRCSRWQMVELCCWGSPRTTEGPEHNPASFDRPPIRINLTTQPPWPPPTWKCWSSPSLSLLFFSLIKWEVEGGCTTFAIALWGFYIQLLSFSQLFGLKTRKILIPKKMDEPCVIY